VSIARELGVPVIETYHTYFEEYLYHYVPLMPRRLMRFIARRFTSSQCKALDALVVPSRAMQDALEDYGVRCPMQIIPTGMEMDRFAAGDGSRFRERLGIAPGQPTLVHVGRIAHEKNIDFLFRVLAEVVMRRQDVVMIVAGEGPALEHCKTYAQALGLTKHVRFVGYLSRDSALLDCYKAGDLFVFSSKTETQGLVLLEAMALGVPVVSTAHMGTADIVKPERGARMAPDDEAGFADIVVQLLNDPQTRAAMAHEAKAHAATWSASAMTTRLIDFYRGAIDARMQPQPELSGQRTG
jgi:glycosyltransferase involved in cell wall biosynthesis